MEEAVRAMQKIIPKEIDILKRRYQILNGIQASQPIGRRSLSQKLLTSEKIIRTDTEFFHAEGYINVTPSGMELTHLGYELVDELKKFMKHLDGLVTIEEKIKDILGCHQVVIVSGDADYSDEAKRNIGKATSKILIDNIKQHTIIALTGGSTVHQVVTQLKEKVVAYEEVLVVPARGSLGNNVEYQANTLVSMLAQKIHCDYRLLNIPDNLSQHALESVRQEPDIQKTIEYIKKANIIVFGIGNVYEMAQRRNHSQETINMLKEKNAVAEALGYYFDHKGEVVYTSRSIGIRIDEMTDLNYPIAVAGGTSKAEAIIAVRKFISKGCLILDESAANEIIRISI